MGLLTPVLRVSALLVLVTGVTACAVKPKAVVTKPTEPEVPKCQAVDAAHPMVGTWYAVSRPKDVAGELRTLTVLSPDGSMKYETQLKIGRKIRPALRESGCWSVQDSVYTLRTLKSNGEWVEFNDPIYTNRYTLESVNQKQFVIREQAKSQPRIVAKKMPDGYRLAY